MYNVRGSESVGREMDSLLFSSNFRCSPAEFTKPKDMIMMHSEQYNYSSNIYNPKDQLKQQQQSCNLPRYQSGPTSFLATQVSDAVAAADDDDDHENNYLDRDISNLEEMDFNARFGSGDSNGLKKKTVMDSVHLVYETDGDLFTSGVAGTFRNLNSSINVDNMNQVKNISSANRSGLIRHSSSPAGFLANLADEIGFTETNNVGNFSCGSKTNTELNSTSSRLGNYMDISSGLSSHSRFMPQIVENANENIETSDGYLANGQHGGNSNMCYVPNFLNDSTCNSLKRNRDGEVKLLSNMNALDTQNDDSKHYTSGLAHQLSLPSTFAEIATMENFMNFQQDSTPCKIRAKRGFATHPRSIAERVRRTRISARMKKLQDLFPDMDKQANTADMLDLAVVYIKDLQKEVQTLNETRAKCTCSGKRK